MRNALSAGFRLLSFSLCLIAGCTLDTRPHVDGGIAQTCLPPAICDAGVGGTSGASGNAESAGTNAGQAGQSGVGVAGMSGIGVAGMSAAGSGGIIASGNGGAVSPIAGSGGTGAIGGTGGSAGGPPPRQPGQSCSQDADCTTAHCNNKLCCANNADCCTTPSDCKATTANGIPLVCNDPTTCQGSGGVIVCTNFQCQAMGGADDDSACDATKEANDCGAYLPVYCNGQADQQTPACPTTCRSNADCKSSAHCDGTCKTNVVNGGVCTQDIDCQSGHCSGNICCGSGDCCLLAAQCPAKYSAAASCDSAPTCQGTHKVATCVLGVFTCGSTLQQDDSACTSSILANACGSAADMFCNGSRSQNAPQCGATCKADGNCDASAYCMLNGSSGTCQPKQANATTCSSNSQCSSGFCGSNRLCCGDTNGQCCEQASDCTDPRYVNTTCTTATCTGSVTAPICRNGACATGPATSDPSQCTGKMNSCPTGYPAATCPALCANSCTGDNDCASGYVCNTTNHACVLPDMNPAGMSGSAGVAGVSLPIAGVSVPIAGVAGM